MVKLKKKTLTIDPGVISKSCFFNTQSLLIKIGISRYTCLCRKYEQFRLFNALFYNFLRKKKILRPPQISVHDRFVLFSSVY